MKTIIIITGVIIVLGVAYYLLSPLWRKVEMNEAVPGGENASVIASGDFVAQAHEVAGTAQLIKSDEGYTVRFENFETINGPDVHIYLSHDLTNNDFVDIGKLKATHGNVNYSVPAGVDVSEYSYVLVWCKAFSVLFSSAELK